MGVNSLPSDWINTSLRKIAELKTGGPAPQGDEYFNNGTNPFVRVKHFDGSTKYVQSWDLITNKAVLAKRLKLFPKETILFPKSGASIRLEKRAKLGVDSFVVSHLCCVRPNLKSIDSDFLYYWLKLVRFAQAVDGSTLPYLNLNELAKYQVPLPPLPEQHRIAAVLSLVQWAIEEQERLIQLTTELKKSLMHKLFTKGTRGEPQKQTEIGPIPESWKVVKLQAIGKVVYGIQAAVANNFDPVGTKILTNKNITLDGEINLEKINYFELKTDRHYETILQKGDLLFNWRSGSKKHVGKTAYFDLDGEYTHSSFILRIRPNQNVNGRFIYYFLNWLRMSDYFIKLQTYAVNAKFNKSAVNVLPTILPSRREQDEIVDAIDAAVNMEKVSIEKEKRFSDLFRTLLHQLMTAQLRVNGLDLSELGIEIGKYQ